LEDDSLNKSYWAFRQDHIKLSDKCRTTQSCLGLYKSL